MIKKSSRKTAAPASTSPRICSRGNLNQPSRQINNAGTRSSTTTPAVVSREKTNCHQNKRSPIVRRRVHPRRMWHSRAITLSNRIKRITLLM
jgi:hypothetical protein